MKLKLRKIIERIILCGIFIGLVLIGSAISAFVVAIPFLIVFPISEFYHIYISVFIGIFFCCLLACLKE